MKSRSRSKLWKAAICRTRIITISKIQCQPKQWASPPTSKPHAGNPISSKPEISEAKHQLGLGERNPKKPFKDFMSNSKKFAPANWQPDTIEFNIIDQVSEHSKDRKERITVRIQEFNDKKRITGSINSLHKKFSNSSQKINPIQDPASYYNKK
jgi:hypothetical protein